MAAPTIYTKPSLPYLLADYGFEDKETVELRKKKEERRRQKKLLKKQAKKSHSFNSDDDDEKDLEKEREREEHYEEMIRDLHKLRDYYYREYTGMLADKVEKQRKEQKERDAEIQKRKLKEEEAERIASHRVKQRLERHTLANTPAPEFVPKSDLYHIIGLENKLRREGKLKTMSDYNKFRENIAQPRVFNHYFNKYKYGELAPKSFVSTDNASSHRDSEVFSLAPEQDFDELLGGPKQPRSLSRISETHENSRPGTENWAITQQYPSMYKSRKSIANIQRQKSDYKQDLEKRFPKLEMPKLHCFTMNLAKKPPDPEEVRQQLELRAKEKQRKQSVRKYTKMYQLAMSNAAASARIFALHEDMDMMLNGPDLCDVIADDHWMEVYGLTDMTASPGESPMPQGADQEDDDQAAIDNRVTDDRETEEEPSDDQGQDPLALTSGQEEAVCEDKTSRSGKSFKKGSAKSRKSSAVTEKQPSPLPLTMEEIHDDCNLKTPKTLSTLWTNYLRAGKPRTDN